MYNFRQLAAIALAVLFVVGVVIYQCGADNSHLLGILQ